VTLFISSCISAFAQTTLTQIQDTQVLAPNGSLFNGTVILTWNGYSGAGASTVAPLSTSAHIYNGVISVLLVPTTSSASGAYYQAVYSSDDGTVSWSEIWVVPASTTPLTISEVRQSSSTSTGGGTGSGTGSGSTSNGTINISQVVGLSTYLSQFTSSLSTITSNVNNLTASVNTLNSNVAALQTALAGITGGTTTTANFEDDQVPAGTTNGNNAVFTLPNSPTPASSLQLYKNGVLQTSSVDYTLSGAQITFLAGAAPAANDSLLAYYRISGTGSTAAIVDFEVPAGSVNGTNSTFRLAATPNPGASLKLYNNGLLLKPGADYNLSNNTITFVPAAIPQTGDLLVASYRH
jgi:hypothetical protein